MILENFKKIKYLITKKHLKYLTAVFFGNQIGGILEMLSLGTIPVIAIYLFNKEKLYKFLEEKNLNFFVDFFKTENSLIISLLILIFFFLFKNFFLVLMVYFQRKVGIIIRNYNIHKLYSKYLYGPYRLHVKKNPAKLIGIISYDVPTACTIIELLVLILRESFLIIYIIALLLFVDPIIFSIIISFFLLFSLIFIFLAKTFSLKKGSILQKERLVLLQAINQTFESIKDIKILKKESFFESNLLRLIKSQEKQKLFLSMTNAIPRFILEIITLIIIFLIIFFSTKFGLSEDKIITTITFLSFSALRIIPAFRTLNTSINSIIFNLPSLEKITEESKELDELKNANYTFANNITKAADSNINFNNKINVKNIFYKYDKNLNYSIEDISFEINKGEKIGLVGPSGSGKTTLINCLLGLLDPNNGAIKSDEKNINTNFDSWKNNIGYVPQDIYLLDDTVKNNISFGLKDSDVNLEKLSNSIEISDSEYFIEGLPNKIETKVGNRGIGLSGGQRQRIGIARSLYNLPKFLILDEATNALDENIEKRVINNIFNIGYDITVLIIAHRISCLENCSKIIYLEGGKVKDIGNYKEITQKYKLI